MRANSDNRIFTPELLAPAGSIEALHAAIEGGADAVYMGGEFNARAFARNFDRDAIKEAISLCRTYGVKCYITLNTLVYEREHREWLEYARYLWECGADAFIVADLGAARALREYIPDVRLHASTQMTVHNSEGVRTLAALGFERVVVARELSRENISAIIENTDTEIEAFVHGALCVSVSGQCLFSSLVGGRSGNRGECAQPCRLEYNGAPVLSLRDNCLASHISEICDMGVHSLKIEGRMKSPEYVYGVVCTYRRLLDERRNATPSEIGEMSRLFSRSGFTDGYYTKRTDGMCGVRTDFDKQKTARIDKFEGLKRKIPIDIDITVCADTPVSLRLATEGKEVTVTGACPSKAQSAPVDEGFVHRAVTKLGATPYEPREVSITLEDGLFLRSAELNALRREGIDALTQLLPRSAATDIEAVLRAERVKTVSLGASARFISERQLVASGVTTEDIERIYLPLSEYREGSAANGIILPPLVYDSEWDSFIDKLREARECGVRYAICSNISEIRIAHELGFTVTADFRLNTLSTRTARELVRLGADEIILSPELKSGGMRDIREQKSVIVYGRIPLMLCEKCVVRECGGCENCRAGEPYYLCDRTGARFPVFREGEHRSVIYNSAVTYMADKQKELERIGDYAAHYIFSDEAPRQIREVLRAYREGRSADSVLGRQTKFRRL